MFSSKKPKVLKSTAFSEFIRNAKSGEKKRVFGDVLKKASVDQEELVKKAKPTINHH